MNLSARPDEGFETPARLPAFIAGPHMRNSLGTLRLSLSESAFGPNPNAVRAVAENLETLWRYPDSEAGQLRESIAAYHGVTPAQVVVGNGIDELLLVAALTLVADGAEAVACEGTYAGHANALAAARAKRRLLPLDAERIDVEALIASMAPGRTILVCNPHNPTGTLLSAGELEELCLSAQRNGSTLLVDEAYIEYAGAEAPSACQYVRQGLPVVVLRTFSKIHGLAGLRCGYALSSASLCEHLASLKNVLVFNVNRLAQVAAAASLADLEFVERVRLRTSWVLSMLSAHVVRLGWPAPPVSATNFLLLEPPCAAAEMTEKLARRGIQVRSGVDFGMPDRVRVSACLEEDLDRVLKALSELTPARECVERRVSA